ncbi:MAG: magnesium/cobalt transporter CorA [Candidatus Krumholzibacteriia bacterium]
MSPRRPRTRRRPLPPRRAAAGTPPGQLTPPPDALRPAVSLFAYGPDDFTELPDATPEAVQEALGRRPVVWVNVDGLGDPELVARFGALFGLHRLALEDVVHTHQRPKIEHYADHLYIVLRLPDPGAEGLESEQISLFLGRNFVLTFQERPGDAFAPVRERIRGGRGRLRSAGPDYLAYALIDAGVDSNFPVIEQLGERLEDMELEIVDRPGRNAVIALHAIRRSLLNLRRGIWPMREMLGALSRETGPLVGDETRLYLRDCYDHAVQIIDLLETYREIAAGLLDVYLSSVSNRMNEIMKVLTIISTIFIPLSFVAGVWGMNFAPDSSPWNMPELRWRYGYPLALGVMATAASGLLIGFRRRGWLGGGGAPREQASAHTTPKGG